MLRCCVSLLAVAGSLALTLPAPSRAQAPESYARRGPYAGIAGSLGIYTGLENSLPNDSDVDNPIGVNGYVGYRVHSLFAVEVAGEWLPDADVDVLNSNIGS